MHRLLLLLFILPLMAHQCSRPQKLLWDKPLQVSRVTTTPVIDGDLSEWKAQAFSSGAWDLGRVKESEWYDSTRNRLTNENENVSAAEDLQAHYYMSWDKKYLYFGAEVKDNRSDVTESKHAPKRWYYKDAIAWFLEIPPDNIDETFGAGDHGFAFIADTTYPAYGAWWRHGTKDTTYLEEPLQPFCDYRVKMLSPGQNGDFVLEARVDLKETIGMRNPGKNSFPHDFTMMIVHCDPDGGEYGGHLLIYGKGDHDSSWTRAWFAPKQR